MPDLPYAEWKRLHDASLPDVQKFERKNLHVTASNGINYRVANYDDPDYAAKVERASVHIAAGFIPTVQRDDGNWEFPDA